MKNNPVIATLVLILQVGITMMVPIFLCAFAAVGLDKLFDTIWFMPPFLVLGIGAAFRNAYILLKGFTKNKSSEGKQHDYIENLKKQGKLNREKKQAYEKEQKNTK